MNEIKQVIVMRKDLKNTKGEKVRTGKLIAQGAHASMAVFFDGSHVNREKDGNGDIDIQIVCSVTEDMLKWYESIFTKVCLAVNSKEELLELHEKAKLSALPTSLITDAGLTEFGGCPTETCIAIGPAKSEDIDKITGHLKLF